MKDRIRSASTLGARMKTALVKVFAVLLVGMILYGFRDAYERKRLDHLKKMEQIATLERENEALLKQNKQTLRSTLPYLNSVEGVEDKAIEELGLTRDGKVPVTLISPPTSSVKVTQPKAQQSLSPQKSCGGGSCWFSSFLKKIGIHRE